MQWYDERVQQLKKNKKPTGSTPERWCACMCVLHACTYWKQICNLMCSYYAVIKCFTTMASICNRLNRRVALVLFDVCVCCLAELWFFSAWNQLQTKLVEIVMGLCCDVIRTESHFPANNPNIISLCLTRSQTNNENVIRLYFNIHNIFFSLVTKLNAQHSTPYSPAMQTVQMIIDLRAQHTHRSKQKTHRESERGGT